MFLAWATFVIRNFFHVPWDRLVGTRSRGRSSGRAICPCDCRDSPGRKEQLSVSNWSSEKAQGDKYEEPFPFLRRLLSV